MLRHRNRPPSSAYSFSTSCRRGGGESHPVGGSLVVIFEWIAGWFVPPGRRGRPAVYPRTGKDWRIVGRVKQQNLGHVLRRGLYRLPPARHRLLRLSCREG